MFCSETPTPLYRMGLGFRNAVRPRVACIRQASEQNPFCRPVDCLSTVQLHFGLAHSKALDKLSIRRSSILGAASMYPVMLKFISAVMAAAAFAGVLTLLSATSTRLDATPARDAAPQSTPVTPTAPVLAAAAISPELVRLEVARDLAVIRNSVEQLAAKQEQMAQNIATLQAAEQEII